VVIKIMMKSSLPILVIDIGNTSTTLGVFDQNDVHRVQRIEKVDQDIESIGSVMLKSAGKRGISGICIASVVPLFNSMWTTACKKSFGMEPVFISHKLKLGISVTYPKPETIGADRLANAVGGVEKYGAPVIIGDFGTAVTFDVVTKKEGYIGGIIAPGPPLMFDYLAERTAQLPRITWKPVKHAIGKSTAEAMQLGAHWGYRGLFKEILRELMKNAALRNATVIATGGFASRMLEGMKPQPIIDPHLTLYGIGCIYANNI